MFVNKYGAQVASDAWVPYSPDGSNNPTTMLEGQPQSVSPQILQLMGLTVQPDPPITVPPNTVISDRQFYQQCAIQGLCTQQEALSAVQIGTLPSSLAPLVNALPADQQWGAKMLLCGATSFIRSNPLVASLGTAFFGAANASASLDALWAAALLL